MKRPLTGLTLSYALGILIAAQLSIPTSALWIAVVVTLVGFIVFRRTRGGTAFLFSAVMATGAVSYQYAATNSSPRHIARQVALRDQNLSLRGMIVTDTGYREAAAASVEPATVRQSFTLELEAINRTNTWEESVGRVLVYVSTNRPVQPLQYGDVIECSAVVRIPPPASNPGVFDWQRWLARQHIEFTATIGPADVCRVLAADQGSSVVKWSLRMREHFERALSWGLADEPELTGVVAGMVIGQRSEIPPDTSREFQQTGVFHVFVTAGLHVGIVTGAVLIFLRLCRIQKRWCALIAIPLLIMYVIATGTRICAVRALVMACVWLIGWMLVRPTDALTVLAAAALGLLLWDPTALFDPAFLLSFSVVLSLVLLTPRIEKPLMKWMAPDPFLPSQLVSPSRKWLEKPLHRVVRLFSGSLAAWIGLLPLMALDFHLWAPISILANLIVIPLVSLIIPVGMLGALAFSFCPELTLILNNANYFLLHVMIKSVNWMNGFPGSHWFVSAPPGWLIIGYYAVLFVWINRQISFLWKGWITAGAIVMAAVIMLVRHDPVVEVTVLNLRNGDAVFVQTPGIRSQSLLLDGGDDWSGEHVMVPFLRAQGVDELSAVIMTRADKAHVAGLTTVAQVIPIQQTYQTSITPRSKFVHQWLETIRQKNLPSDRLHAGDERRIGEKLYWRVLHPTPDSSRERTLVSMLQYGTMRVLLTSDSGPEIERKLISSGANLRAHVIIQGRKGDQAASSDEFLDAVKPEVLIQTVTSGRFPDPGLPDRLQKRGIRLYRTDESGAVTVRLKETVYEIQTCLNADARLGNEP